MKDKKLGRPIRKWVSPLRSLWLRFCAVRQQSGFQSGWGLIGWGIAAFLGTPDYAGLSRYASPWVWAIIPSLLGIVQLAVVFAGPAQWQRRMATSMAGVWFGLWVFLIASHAHVVMLTIVPTFVIANALTSLLPPDPPRKRKEDIGFENLDLRRTFVSAPAALAPTIPNQASPLPRIAGDKGHDTA